MKGSLHLGTTAYFICLFFQPNMSLIYMNGPQIEKQDNSTYPMLPPPGPKPNGTGLIGKKNIPVSPVQSLKTLSLFPSGLDHAYASNRSDKVTVEILTKEIQSLKQILTLHLNLIEQQSKKIELKDQELLALREEHEFVSILYLFKLFYYYFGIECNQKKGSVYLLLN